MGKKSRTMQRTAAKHAPAAPLTKKQIARSRKEQRQLRIIWASVAAVAIVVIGVVAFALIRELVAIPNSPVAVVNGHKISSRDFAPMLTFRRAQLHNNINALEYQLKTMDTTSEENQFLVSFYQQQLGQLKSMLTTASDSTLDEMIDAELIREKAAEASLTVTPAEIDQDIQNQLQQALSSGSSPVTNTEGITVTPTAIPQSTLDDTYKQNLAAMRITDRDYRNLVESSLLRQKVQDLLASQVPTMGLIVHVQLIEVNVSNTVTTTLQRVESGEDFATVAKEVSSVSTAKTDGGDLGWQAAGMLSSRYGAGVETLAMTLTPGQVSKTFSNGKWYVVRVAERNENGPLPEEALSTSRDNALTTWLEEQKKTAEIKRLLSESQIPPDPFPTTQTTTGQ